MQSNGSCMKPTQHKENCTDVLLQRKAGDYGAKQRNGLTVVQRGFFTIMFFLFSNFYPQTPSLPTSPDCLKLFFYVSASYMW